MGVSIDATMIVVSVDGRAYRSLGPIRSWDLHSLIDPSGWTDEPKDRQDAVIFGTQARMLDRIRELELMNAELERQNRALRTQIWVADHTAGGDE